MAVELFTCPPSAGPYELFAIEGNTAILPPGETVTATYTDMNALLAANEPSFVGQRIQVAISGQVELYEANYIDSAWSWVLVPTGPIVVAPTALIADAVGPGSVFEPSLTVMAPLLLSNGTIESGAVFGPG